MPDHSDNIEKLDLRFRAAPASRSGLPGGVVIWFLLGAVVGIGGWVLGRKELQQRLSTQVANGNATTSLLAIEALETLEPDTLDHLIDGLQHADARVARAAHQKLQAHLERWSSLDVTEQFAQMRMLVDELQRLPRTLPEANRSLVRSLAARLYSTTISIDDPQIKPVTQICERLLAFDNVSVAIDDTNTIPQSPPNPLPPVATVATVLPDASEGTRNSPAADSSAGPSSASLRLVAAPTRPRTSMTHSANHSSSSGSGVAMSLNDDSSRNKPSESVDTSIRHDRPLIVATPASIATQPALQTKVVSERPDLVGIEKLEIAELVRLLAHENADVAKAAATAMRAKGMTDQRIELASELAVGSSERRLQLIQQLASAGDVDPRPWLLWMAEDGQPVVRRMAVSLLVPLADDSVQHAFRNLATREQDPQIREIIQHSLASLSK